MSITNKKDFSDFQSKNDTKGDFPQDLMQDSRNLLRIRDPSVPIKQLKQGKLSIVASLNSLPETHHVTDSFVIDVPFFSNALVSIVVNGLVVESWKKVKNLRSFTRSFTIIPQGQGFVIINDMLILSHSTKEQKGKFSAIVRSSNLLSANSSTSLNTQSEKDQLILRLRQETGMNEAFTRQCLEEASYDYNKAISMFHQLNSVGAIPAEAFQA